MYTTIAAITHRLAFSPRQTQRVQKLLAGRDIEPGQYYADAILDACRRVEREDGWTTMVEQSEVARMAVALRDNQSAPLWQSLERRKWRCGRYAMVDVLEALADAESVGWGVAP